jgi:hypothetical protein
VAKNKKGGLNDFVIRIGTVNGTGSASANGLLIFTAADLSPGIRAIASWSLPPLDRRGGRPNEAQAFQ